MWIINQQLVCDETPRASVVNHRPFPSLLAHIESATLLVSQQQQQQHRRRRE